MGNVPAVPPPPGRAEIPRAANSEIDQTNGASEIMNRSSTDMVIVDIFILIRDVILL